MVCLQETKREHFDFQFIKRFCLSSFDSFEFLPSEGASGGIIIIWQSHLFHGRLAFRNEYGISVEFTSLHSDVDWILTNIYGTCAQHGKHFCISWLNNIHMPTEVNWLLVGHFNLIQKPEDRNKPGGDIMDMFLFNEAISALGVEELPLNGQRFTWTNKQASPLLECLDWFFTSQSWTNLFPGSKVTSLTMETSDHVPCLITAKTAIPKGRAFRFDNYLIEHEQFMNVVQHGLTDCAKVISTKFKNLRRVIKAWQAHLSSLSQYY